MLPAAWKEALGLEARTDVGDLAGLSPIEVDRLRSAGFATAEALRDLVATDGLDAAVERTWVSTRRLRRALARHAVREAEGRTRPPALRALEWAGDNRLELCLLVLAVLAAAGLARAALRPERDVVAVSDLAPFRIIGPADVEERRTQADFGTFASPADVVGRFPLEKVPAGEPLRRELLGRVRFERGDELAGHRVVAVPVAPHSVALALPGARVTLLLVPEGDQEAGQQAHVVDGAMVMDVRGAGDTASLVVAIPEAALPGALPALGGSRAVVLQRVPPAPAAASPPGAAGEGQRAPPPR